MQFVRGVKNFELATAFGGVDDDEFVAEKGDCVDEEAAMFGLC